MVAKSDIATVNTLFQQYLQYSDAMIVFDSPNPYISAFVVNVRDPDQSIPLADVTVSAEGITSPPQMMAAIKAQIEKRLAAITDELKQLGVDPGS